MRDDCNRFWFVLQFNTKENYSISIKIYINYYSKIFKFNKSKTY